MPSWLIFLTDKSVKKKVPGWQQSLNVFSLKRRRQKNSSMWRTSFTVSCTRFSEKGARNIFISNLYSSQRKSFNLLREEDDPNLPGLLQTGRTIKPEARRIVQVLSYLTRALRSLIDTNNRISLLKKITIVIYILHSWIHALKLPRY